MAVQAQYPSNALVLDRNEQENKNMDYPFHGQATGLFDQSTILYTNGGMSNNIRKRGREVIPGTTRRQNPINLFSSRPQPSASSNPPPILSLPHLQTQPSLVSTGLRLSIEGQQHKLHHQQPSSIRSLPLLSSFLTEELTAQIKYQKDEIDQFLHAQGEQLRRTLADNRQRHYRSLLRLAEESASKRLNEKEAEVEKVARRNAELEEKVARLRAESIAWQAKARAEETAAVTLQAQLQHVAARQQYQERGEEPTGCAGDLAAEDAESVYIDPERRVETSLAAGLVACRACRERPVSVVVLPCRHLCLCRDCDAAVEACPVCFCVRSASVEVYLS